MRPVSFRDAWPIGDLENPYLSVLGVRLRLDIRAFVKSPDLQTTEGDALCLHEEPAVGLEDQPVEIVEEFHIGDSGLRVRRQLEGSLDS